jgi:rsbT antagonist protein RsbS
VTSSEENRIPIIALPGSLLVSVHGTIDERQLTSLREDLASAVDRDEATSLIVDLSGVEFLDSYLTRTIRDLALTAKFMAIRTVICGMRPAVATTLVEMGLSIPGVSTELSVKRALERMAREVVLEQGEGESDVAVHGADD